MRLAGARSYWLGTTMPAGSPHAAPVWGVVIRDVLYLYSERRTAKSRNLAADPRAVVHLESADDVVIVRGTAEDLGTPAQVPAVVAGLAEKYADEGDRQYLPDADPDFDVVYAIRPQSAMMWRLSDYEGSQRRWSAQVVVDASSEGDGMGQNTEIAILAGGCFWPLQELLRQRNGVISTRVGYTGGENDNPTADSHPGHAEAVEVIFDPGQTRYQDLVEFFLQAHRPDLGGELVGSGYRSEIFYASDGQRKVAEDAIARADASGMWPGRVVTQVSEATRFWEAEAQDQEYLSHYLDDKNQFSR